MAHDLRHPRFVIMSLPRGGSHFLATALDSHPDLRVAGELLYRPKDYGMEVDALPQLYEWAFERYNGFIHHRSNKINCLPHASPHAFWRHLATQTDAKVISLRRRDLLAMTLSLNLAIETNVWQVEAPCRSSAIVDATRDDWCSKQQAPPINILVKPHIVLERIERYRAECAFYDALIPTENKITIWYEDLVDNFAKYMLDIQLFLGVSPTTLVPSTVKQGTRPLSACIANYSEVQKLVGRLAIDEG